jgi:hypothetical protein
MPVGYSTPDLLADWSLASLVGSSGANVTLALLRANGSLFAATIPAARQAVAGVYRLRVRLKNGWRHGANDVVEECILLERDVLIEPQPTPDGVNTVWLAVGSLSASVILVCAVLFYARRRSKMLRDLILMVVTEGSKTLFSISCELGDLGSDLLTTYRVIFEGVVRSQQYLVPYAVFGCLSICVGMVSLSHHVRRVRELHSDIKARAKVQPDADADLGDETFELGDESDENLADSTGGALVRKLKWEVKKAHRDLKSLSFRILGLLLEDLPMVQPDPIPPKRLLLEFLFRAYELL